MYKTSFILFIGAFFCDEPVYMWLMLLASVSLLIWVGVLDLVEYIDEDEE
jgi:hypothetical protein